MRQQNNTDDLSTLLSNLPGMAYRCRHDLAWTMLFVSNGCLELTGFPPVDLIHDTHASFGELIHPEDRKRVWQAVEAAVALRKSFDITYRITTVRGEEKWVRDVGRGVFLPEGELLVLEGFVSDITDHKRSENRIQSQLQRFAALRKIDTAITASFDLRVTLDILLEQVTVHLGVDAADVLLFQPASKTLKYGASRGFHTLALQHTNLRLGEGFAGLAALQRRTIHNPRLDQEYGELSRAPQLAAEKFVTYFGVPLIAKSQVKGILEIFHRSRLETDGEWLDFMEALAGQAAIAIDNATLFDDLQRSNLELTLAYDATLEGWSKALELRDQDTEGHTQRVVDRTLNLAQAIGIDTAQLHHIRRGALLHDIGKMGIPDSILLKPGPLSSDEWQIMRQHPVYAYRLLSPVSNLRSALDIPYCHHERWDGNGYPRGLKGEGIPIAARIFAVVDVWDALTSDRPYRLAWPEEKALLYIQEQSGKHFEPQIAETFLRLFT